MQVQDRISRRVILVADYMLENDATIRDAATRLGVSKSTVYLDVKVRLRSINRGLYYLICNLLERHKAERHIRGGEATRQKYAAMR